MYFCILWFLGGFTSVFIGIRCLPWPVRYVLLFIYLLFALKALHAAVFAVGPWERRISFAAMFIMRICVLGVRYSPYGGGHPEVIKFSKFNISYIFITEQLNIKQRLKFYCYYGNVVNNLHYLFIRIKFFNCGN